jgi:hypothetical protein
MQCLHESIFYALDEKRKAKQKNKKTKKVNKKAAQTSSTCNQDSDEEEEDVGSKLADSDDHTSTAHSDKENVRSKFVDNDHTSPASHHSHVAGGTLGLCFLMFSDFVATNSAL